jgi:hypothetical protein
MTGTRAIRRTAEGSIDLDHYYRRIHRARRMAIRRAWRSALAALSRAWTRASQGRVVPAPAVFSPGAASVPPAPRHRHGRG